MRLIRDVACSSPLPFRDGITCHLAVFHTGNHHWCDADTTIEWSNELRTLIETGRNRDKH